MLNFTLKLEKHLYLIDIPANVSTTRNIVFSPVNIATVMAVTLAGSAGRTFDEMSRVFDIQKAAGIPADYSEIAHQLFGEMLEELNKSYGSTIVETMSILLFQVSDTIMYLL